MINDIGGAAFIAMLIAMLMLFMWALAEAAQRKDLEKQVRMLQLKLHEAEKKEKKPVIRTDFLEIFKEEENK